MRKITFLIVMFFVSCMAFAQFPAPYCGPIAFANNEEPITLVNFAGINNSSPNTLGGVAHQDFTAIVGNVTAGQTYPITLKGNTDGNFNTNLSVFIDWNQDGDFTDSGETYNIGSIMNSDGLDTVVLNGSITASASALGGNTRMRVVKKFNNSTTVFPDSCNTGGGGWGEAEDYTLSVTAIPACLTGFNYPTATVTPGTCDGFTPTQIADDSWAGDYFNVAVTTGQTYKFGSSLATDFFTISTDNGVTAVTAGTQPLTWVSTVTGTIRVHINTNSACGTEDVDRTTTVTCGVLCLTGTLYPATTYTPGTCDGTTVNVVAVDSYAGEYSNINVVTTNTYTFSSSIATDYITVASADGTTALAVGTGSVDYTPTADGVVRVYFHTNSSCGTQATDREKRVVCDTALMAPGCASNPTPADAAIVPAFDDIILSWDAPTTGDPATSYDIYVGNSPTTLNFAVNVPTNDPINGGEVGAYSTTIYWQIVPRNAAGPAVGCAVWSFTTEDLPVCLSNTFQYPATDITPTACDGIASTLVANDSWAGDYYNLNVIAGETYTLNSSVATDYLTISTDGNVTAATAGQVPLVWVATVTGVVRVNINTDSACGTADVNRTTSVICGVACLNGDLYPADTVIPSVCDGSTLNQITDDAYAGEYSNVQVEAGNTYTFSSSVATDFFTLSSDGVIAIAEGVGPLSWVATYSGVVRVYLHTDDACGDEAVGRFKYVVCTPVAPCLTATFGQFPAAAYVPSACDGVTQQQIVANGWAGEYALVTVTSGETYTFSSSVATDVITISADAGATAAAVGVGSVTWVATISGDVRFYTHLAGCGDQQTNRAKFVLCGVVSSDEPDYVALQWPPTITVTAGGSGTVYGQVYEAGLTDVAPNIDGQAPGIAAWVGISPAGDNSNPNTWTTWVPATWNAAHISNNDEYEAQIGATLAPGTYYYATRFSLNNGPYVYGGINSSNQGNEWDGTTYLSGVLTVNPIANDECSGAIALTTGAVFGTNPLSTTNAGASTGSLTPSCQANFSSDAWYSVVVPASGSITIETQADGGMTDSVVSAFTGSCTGTLTEVGCNDDDGIGFMSLLSLTGLTPGDTVYIAVWRYSFLGGGTNGSFVISAYDASLSNVDFESSSLRAYPNPVRDVLNLSYTQNITKVEVINLLGQQVIAKPMNATQSQIDMSHLPNGTYLVRVTADDQVKTIKVIKE
ncbi:T9SS type A sorting domain-containing protein [Flavobacterium sp.]|uniref:T9SS type A sorting domain-containing protein n=1 Tax=Flavobacterium sp. TaxID=239 RepID=UPI002B4AC691|nr:T9SS type A sorting domain-containing protein [Flavobacterium sp.]HLP65117.1 T9SS type A sorting domain-containing protein [Flavobacterium sp.]